MGVCVVCSTADILGMCVLCFFFFFQAEDGIRDGHVTGVQTCALPICPSFAPFGIVEAVGPRAKGVKLGQRRIVYPWIGCGQCPVCKAGQDNYCLKSRFLGVNRAGAYSTHVLVPDAKYLVDAGVIDESFAATLACSALTAYSASAKLPALGAKDRVAVIGCGGVGLVGISVLRAKGVKNIVACDIDEAKLAAEIGRAARRGTEEVWGLSS